MNSPLATYAACLILAAAALPAAELPEASPQSLGISEEKLEQVDAYMERQVQTQRIAGGIVMISYRGKICFFKTYGKQDLEADIAMQEDTIFRIYSMSKAVTTAAALKLYEEGKIGLDDPVSEYIPSFENITVAGEQGPRPPKRPVTIKDLMLHTSGFTYGEGPELTQQAWDAQKIWEAKDLADAVDRLSEVPLAFDPGTDWHYGISIGILGRVVEVASGQSLESYLEETFFKPLDMPDTGFYVPSGPSPDDKGKRSKLSRLAAVYEPVEGGGLERRESDAPFDFTRPPTIAYGGGGLVSTARDYMRFLSMIDRGGELDGTRILQADTIKLMTSNQLPESAFPIHFGDDRQFGRGFGLGFAVRTDAKQDTIGRIGEYGWGGAASTHNWGLPDQELIVITLEQIMPYRHDTEDGIKEFIYEAIRAPKP